MAQSSGCFLIGENNMPVAGALIGVAGAIGGAAISSSGAKSAANTAAQASANNNALAADIYSKNTANETPFMQSGQQANSTLQALLGLGGQQTQQYSQGQWNPITGQYIPGAPTPGQSNADAANAAFNQFTNSDGYQFRLNQGLNAVNTNYATHGALQSGAALKGLNDYAQGQASNEFGKYVGYLQNQQGVGLSATNALAGVGTNYVGQVSSNNNNAANVAGAAAQSSANAWSNGLTGALGALTGSR
jgi:hypothetical protein